MEAQEDKNIILLTAAQLLAYPDKHFMSTVTDIQDSLEEAHLPEDCYHDCLTLTQTFASYDLESLQKLYVKTFDWQEKTGLYLTAHEHGDDPKRGAALIQLQKLVNQAGYDRIEGELADYMPMLFELLAVSDQGKVERKLKKRLAKTVWRIRNHLPDDHLYRAVLNLLTNYVFEAPTHKEMEELTEEDPDLDTMPFPMLYH